jgi:hypothetical protein
MALSRVAGLSPTFSLDIVSCTVTLAQAASMTLGSSASILIM